VTDAWPEYVEALKVIARAPDAARSRWEREQAAAAGRSRAEDERLRGVVERREQLRERSAQAAARSARLLAEHGVPAVGPLLAVPVPAPATMPDALRAIDSLERQLHDDLDRLAAARELAARPAPRPRRWRGLVVGLVVGLALLVAAATAVAVLLWRG
jgi:hypothetical protein